MIGIKPWLAEAENYSQGTLETFWLKSSALRWLRDQETFDRQTLKNQWTGHGEILKDRLKNATIIQELSGAVTIIYNDEGGGTDAHPHPESPGDEVTEAVVDQERQR